MPVASAADIKFETVSTVVECEIKGGNRVFRRVPAGATMAEK